MSQINRIIRIIVKLNNSDNNSQITKKKKKILIFNRIFMEQISSKILKCFSSLLWCIHFLKYFCCTVMRFTSRRKLLRRILFYLSITTTIDCVKVYFYLMNYYVFTVIFTFKIIFFFNQVNLYVWYYLLFNSLCINY